MIPRLFLSLIAPILLSACVSSSISYPGIGPSTKTKVEGTTVHVSFEHCSVVYPAFGFGHEGKYKYIVESENVLSELIEARGFKLTDEENADFSLTFSCDHATGSESFVLLKGIASSLTVSVIPTLRSFDNAVFLDVVDTRDRNDEFITQTQGKGKTTSFQWLPLLIAPKGMSDESVSGYFKYAVTTALESAIDEYAFD